MPVATGRFEDGDGYIAHAFADPAFRRERRLHNEVGGGRDVARHLERRCQFVGGDVAPVLELAAKGLVFLPGGAGHGDGCARSPPGGVAATSLPEGGFLGWLGRAGKHRNGKRQSGK